MYTLGVYVLLSTDPVISSSRLAGSADFMRTSFFTRQFMSISLLMEGEIPPILAIRARSSCGSSISALTSLNGILSCSGGYLYIIPGSSCLYLFTSIEMRLIESMIFPVSISTSTMLLCLDMISIISLRLTENPISFWASISISIIRSESFCLISVMRPP